MQMWSMDVIKFVQLAARFHFRKVYENELSIPHSTFTEVWAPSQNFKLALEFWFGKLA